MGSSYRQGFIGEIHAASKEARFDAIYRFFSLSYIAVLSLQFFSILCKRYIQSTAIEESLQ